MTEAIIELSEVSKRFGGLIAAKDVCFEVIKGEIIGLIGPNGAGKTTLINLITGNLHPDAGLIVFNGEEIQRLTPHRISRLGIARTYQVVMPFRGMTVLENIATGAFFGVEGRKRNRKQAFERAHEIAVFCGLSDKANEFVDSLTIGDVRRLEIAKALATDPVMLLLDEALAGLNPKEIDESLKFIKQINQMGITILIIEHIMRVVMSISNRVVVLHHGEVMCTDSPEAVVQNQDVIKAYLGEKYLKRIKK